MARQPNTDHDWVQDAERWICRIDGVRQCKIDLDRNGEVAAIHVVADKSREPRHIVRDVESLLKARLDLNVYYKKIGVVQVLEPEAMAVAGAGETAATASPSVAEEVVLTGKAMAAGGGVATASSSAPAAPSADKAAATGATSPAASRAGAAAGEGGAAPGGEHPWENAGWQGPRPVENQPISAPLPAPRRVECRGVGVTAAGALLTAMVELAVGERTARAEERGPNQPGLENQLLGRATVAALRDLIADPVTLNLTDVREIDLAGEPVVCVAVDLVEGRRRERLFGSCSRAGAAQMAPVLAVLDALNRRLGLFELSGGTV